MNEETIRVITLYQPWATLLAHGIKMNETRPKPTSHTAEKGIYLIHAAKKWDKELFQLCFNEPFISELRKLGYAKRTKTSFDWTMPRGCIIGSFEVKECLTVIGEAMWKAILEDGQKIMDNELDFGDYSEGRSVWIGQNHKVLKDPIPYKGSQGYYAKFKGDINDLNFL